MERKSARLPQLGGDLFLTDVRAYRERLLAGTGLTPLFPLWGEPTPALAERCCALGIAARLVCVDTTQLAPDFVGRVKVVVSQ